MKLLSLFRLYTRPDALGTFARRLLIMVIFILPLFILPTTWLPISAVKMTVLAFGVLIALLAWTVARMKEHAVTFPHTNVIYSLLLLMVGYLISAFLSPHVFRSLLGFGIERDTVFAMLIFVSALVGVAITTKTVADFMKVQRALLISFVIIGVFQIIRIVIGGGVFLPQIFSSDPTMSLLGSWNDLAVLSGFVTIIALTGLSLFSSRRVRLGMYITLAIAIILLVFVNLTIVWATLTLIVFFLMVYIFSDSSYDRESGKFNPHVPWMRLFPGAVVLLLSIVFLVFGSSIGTSINKTFGISFVDVRPSWEGTMQIGASVYKNNLLFGIGPNSFQDAWIAYKPASVNQTTFWNSDFTFGVGLIPTEFITGGIVVGILWIFFFISLLYVGIKIFSRRLVQPSLMYITISSYFGVIYLWIISIVYIPQIVLIALMFMFTGAAIAAARISGVLRVREIRSDTSYASGLALTGVLVTSFIILSGSLVILGTEVYTNSMLTRAVVIANTGDFTKAERYVHNANIFFTDERTPRLLTNFGIIEMRNVLSKKSDDIDAQRKEFQEKLTKTISSAQALVKMDSTNYRNWLLLGDIYSQLVPLKIDGASDSAVQAYNSASVVNTMTPLPDISLAQLALGQKDYETARKHAEDALKIKSDYTDAHYLLSQVAIAEKKTDEAIASTESAVLLRPNNAGLLFQLGILQYSVKDYKKAVPVLERAVTVNPNYSNALYFLGLSYEKTGKKDASLAVFKRIEKLNPDNKDIKNIVVALESGKTIESVLKTKTSNVSTTSALPVRAK